MPPRTAKPAFARRLRQLREAAGLSVAELAAKLGVSRQAVHQLEAGRAQPAWETVQRLADVLGLSTEDLRG